MRAVSKDSKSFKSPKRLSKIAKSALAGALALGVSAHAAGAITGYPESATGIGRIGLGGVYHADSLQGQNLNAFGGFIALSADGMYKRFKTSLYGRFGLSSTGQGRMVGNYEVLPKFGFNILTHNVPLYVNLIFYYDDRGIVTTGAGAGNGIDVAHRSFGIGGELEGKIPLGSSVALEYGAGYTYDPGIAYRFYPSENLSLVARGGGASTILAHIGMAFDINEYMHSYARLTGRYQYLPASPVVDYAGTQYAISARNAFSAMFEVGIGF